MASVYDFKGAFQRLLRPTVESLIDRGVSPNQITTGGLVVSVLVGATIWNSRHFSVPVMSFDAPLLVLVVPPMLLLRMALNAIDGMIARETGSSTPKGMIYNEAADVVGDWLCYLPIATLPIGLALETLAFVLVGTLAELVGIAARAAGGLRAYQGPMGKSDRALLIAVSVPLIMVDHRILGVALWVGVVLGIVTVFNRARTVGTST